MQLAQSLMRETERAQARPTHAGGIVFRPSAAGNQYLLVRARGPTAEWVFPKGHIEAGETAERAALREVQEEAGIVARIVVRLPRLEFGADRVEMFVMAFTSAAPRPAERESQWRSLDEALALLTFTESKDLLTHADRIVRGLP